MGKEKLKRVIQRKEAKIIGKDFETEKEEVEGEKGIVDEGKVNEAIGAIEVRLKNSPLSQKFKEKIAKKLNESTNNWKKKVEKFKAEQSREYENKFKILFEKILEDFAKFEKKPEVKEIFESIEPLFENKIGVQQIINLESYKRRSKDWEKMNARLTLFGFDAGKISSIQRLLGITIDGKVGPQTINAINEKIYEEKHEVKWSDEATVHKGESPEEFSLRADEAEEITSSEGWNSIELETRKKQEEIRKKQEGAKTVANIEKFEKEERQVKAADGKAKQEYIASFRAVKVKLEAEAGEPGRKEEVAKVKKVEEAKAEREKVEVLEAATKMEIEKQKVDRLMMEQEKAVTYYFESLTLSGNIAPRRINALEKYHQATLKLYQGLKEIVGIKEAYIEKDPDRRREREEALNKYEDRNTFDVLMIVEGQHPQYEFIKKKAEKRTYKIPSSQKHLDRIIQAAEDQLLLERRNLYLITGRKLYKKDFEESQDRIKQKFAEDSDEVLDAATQKDNKTEIEGVTEEEKTLVQGEVRNLSNLIIGQLDEFQRAQARNPGKTYHGCIGLIKHLIMIKGGRMPMGHILRDMSIKKPTNKDFVYKGVPGWDKIQFEVLNKHPNLKATFDKMLSTYISQAERMARDSIHNNSIMIAFDNDSKELARRVQGLQSSYSHLATSMKSVEEGGKGEDTPSREFMALLHRDAEHILHSGLLDQVQSSPAHRFMQSLKPISGNDKIFGKINKLVEPIQKKVKKLAEFGPNVRKLCNAVRMIEGTGMGAWEFIQDSTKVIIVVVAAVAAAILTGGVAAAAGAGWVATTVAIGTTSAIAAQYTTALVEGSLAPIESSENMLKAVGTSILFMGAARVGGNLFGKVLGKGAGFVAEKIPGISKKGMKAFQNYAEKLIAKSTKGGKPITKSRGFMRNLVNESTEEGVEEGLQRVAEGLIGSGTKEGQYVGLAISCLLSSRGSAKQNLMQSLNLDLGGGLTGVFNDNNVVEMKYNNRAEAITFLKNIKAPEEVLKQFEATGSLDLVGGGGGIKIVPTKEAGETRKTFGSIKGKKILSNSELTFNEETGIHEYKNPLQSENLLKYLKSERYLVDIDQNGNIIAERGNEKVEINFKGKKTAEGVVDFKAGTEVKAKAETKTESKPGPELVNKIKDPKLKRNVQDLIKSLWGKSDTFLKNNLERIGKNWNAIKAKVRAVSSELYNKIKNRLVEIRKRETKIIKKELERFEFLPEEKKQMLAELWPNGIEVSNFKQGNTGNCWLLARLNGLKRNPLAPYILARSIRKVGKGKWEVRFPGQEIVEVKASELKGQRVLNPKKGRFFTLARTVSTGQSGDGLLVVAMGKLIAKAEGMKYWAEAVEGGQIREEWDMREELSLFLGDLVLEEISEFPVRGTEDSWDIRYFKMKEVLEKFSKNPEEFVLAAYTRRDAAKGYVRGSNRYMDLEGRFIQYHAFTIVKVDSLKEEVTIANPWDTAERVHTLSYDQFADYFGEIRGVKIDKRKLLPITGYLKNPNKKYVEGISNQGLVPFFPYKYKVEEAAESFVYLGSQKVKCSIDPTIDSLVIDFGKEGVPIRRIQSGEEVTIGEKAYAKIKYLGNGEMLLTDMNLEPQTQLKRLSKDPLTGKEEFIGHLGHEGFSYDIREGKTIIAEVSPDLSISFTKRGDTIEVNIDKLGLRLKYEEGTVQNEYLDRKWFIEHGFPEATGISYHIDTTDTPFIKIKSSEPEGYIKIGIKYK